MRYAFLSVAAALLSSSVLADGAPSRFNEATVAQLQRGREIAYV